MFAGSILDLEPDTPYEARFVLSDPDGLVGQSGKTLTKVVKVRTRPEPMPAVGGKVYHVYPTDYNGARIEPAFDGLMCAYNYYCGGGDTVTAGRPRIKPGDTVLMHAGVYKYHPEYYTGDRTINSTTPVEGTYYLTARGTPEKPIVIKAAGDGEVIFDGNGNFNLFNTKVADYTYFEGVTIRNTVIGIWAGTQFIAGSKGLTVKRCRFEDVNLGIFTNYAGSNNFYIADNYFIGRDDSKHHLGWNGNFWAQFNGVEGQVFPPILASYTAVLARAELQIKSIWKIQPAVGLSLFGQFGWIPASQLISLPSCIASPWGSQEFGTKSTVSWTLPVAASYLTRHGRYSL